MTFEEWSENYFGKGVDVPLACRAAYEAGFEQSATKIAEALGDNCGWAEGLYQDNLGTYIRSFSWK